MLVFTARTCGGFSFFFSFLLLDLVHRWVVKHSILWGNKNELTLSPTDTVLTATLQISHVSKDKEQRGGESVSGIFFFTFCTFQRQVHRSAAWHRRCTV